MLSLKAKAGRSGLYLAIPALCILVATIATVVFALDRMAGVVNRIEDTLTLRATEAATSAVLLRLGQSNSDYAEWDDAVRRLYGQVDPVFVSETFAAASAAEIFFDTAYVIEANGTVLAAVRLGEAVDASLDEAFGPGLLPLLGQLPQSGRLYDVRTGFVAGAWGLAAVAVGPVVPASADFPMPPGPRRFLVLAKAFDHSAVNLLSREYLIEGLRFVRPDERARSDLEIVDPLGTRLASLTWAPGELGNQAHANVGPLVAIMLGLIAVTVGALTIIAVRGLNRIKISEDRARYAAAHDALTGLPNRAELIRQLGEVVAGVHRNGEVAGLIYLDLDGFKDVNDSYGHDVGDRLLRDIAAGLKSMFGQRPVLRLGGDEFAILWRGDRAVEKASEAARLLTRYLAQPFDIEGRIIVVGMSIGIAAIDSTVATPEEALRRADIAMYQAKRQGRNRAVVYDPSVDSARQERLEIAAELGSALRAGSFEILYQPVLSAATGRIVGAEALLRWPRANGESLPAGVFVPIAEEMGLIDDLGIWVLRRACREALAWRGIQVAVNVSPAQLRNPNFENLVQRALSDTGLPAARLALEVTENFLVSNPVQARESIDAIRALGVSVALDDFGTGYSSVGYLRSFTFDRMKLDGSLISGIASDPRAQRFVQATIALADSLGLGVVAEGVESEEEAILLRLAGCRELQGYHFAAPCTAVEFARLLEQQAAPAPALSA